MSSTSRTGRGTVGDGNGAARAQYGGASSTQARPRVFWNPALVQDPSRGPVLLALASLCVACAGVAALRWVTGKDSAPIVNVVQLTASAWLAALVVSRGRVGRTLLQFTPYLVSALALTTLVAMQATGDAADPAHTHSLLAAYLALPVTYLLFFLLRPPSEALIGSLATCAVVTAAQFALPPLFVGRVSYDHWTALLIAYWNGAVVMLLWAVPRLRSDRDLLQAVMRSAQDAMVLLVPRGRARTAAWHSNASLAEFRVAFANAAATRDFGVKAGSDLVADAALRSARELFEALAETHNRRAEVALDTRLPTLEGLRWFRVTAAPYESGVAATLVDITDHKETEGRALAMAFTDPLTGLANRRGFEVEAARRFATTEAGGEHLTLCYIDLDRFKEVNDRFGHMAGDDLLKDVARRLRSSVRGTDLVARIGGDEFVVLAGGLPDEFVEPFFQRLHASFAAPFEVAGRQVWVRPSLGVVPRAEELVDALAAADAAMYDAKQRGGGVVLTSPVARSPLQELGAS